MGLYDLYYILYQNDCLQPLRFHKQQVMAALPPLRLVFCAFQNTLFGCEGGAVAFTASDFLP